jgi:hypothetical protein
VGTARFKSKSTAADKGSTDNGAGSGPRLNFVGELVGGVPVRYIDTRARILALAALAESCARCLLPSVTPFTKNFGGTFCRTCQLQRVAFPGVCQLPSATMISRLFSSIEVICQIPAHFHTGYPCHNQTREMVSSGEAANCGGLTSLLRPATCQSFG